MVAHKYSSEEAKIIKNGYDDSRIRGMSWRRTLYNDVDDAIHL